MSRLFSLIQFYVGFGLKHFVDSAQTPQDKRFYQKMKQTHYTTLQLQSYKVILVTIFHQRVQWDDSTLILLEKKSGLWDLSDNLLAK